jgi:hypothetical protein
MKSHAHALKIAPLSMKGLIFIINTFSFHVLTTQKPVIILNCGYLCVGIAMLGCSCQFVWC